jgi:hypothetical protein
MKLLVKRKAPLYLITDAKGQAVIESIFLLPFMVAFFIFIYQSFAILNKAQVAQKALRGSVIRSSLNRYDTETVGAFLETNNSPDGSFAFSFVDASPMQGAGVKYQVSSIVSSLILLFANKEQEEALNDFFTSLSAPMSMGICTGGSTAMGNSINSSVLDLGNSPFTCSR